MGIGPFGWLDPSLFGGGQIDPRLAALGGPGGVGMSGFAALLGGLLGNTGNGIGAGASTLGGAVRQSPLGQAVPGQGSAMSGQGNIGGTASQIGSNVRESAPAQAVMGHTPVAPGTPPRQNSGIQPRDAAVSQQAMGRNNTVGEGGKAGMATLLQERGINPYASGNPYAQDLMQNADALTLQGKLEGLMNPGQAADQSMGNVANRVLSNQGVYFDPQTAAQVYQSLTPLAQAYATNKDTSGPANLAYETFFGNNSAPNVAQLLYGTQSGALGQALRGSTLQQAAQGQFRYQHPDQFEGMPSPETFMGWLDAYNRSRPK
jgi:hypothetical protein